MLQKQKISTITTVYNCENYIKEAIISIVQQNYQPMEIIIVDDGSTDNTKQEIKKLNLDNINYIYQRHQGIAIAMNHGIKNATGEYFAFLDADDMWSASKTTLQLKYLTENDSVDAVFGYVQNFYSPEIMSEIASKIHCPPDPMPGFSSQSMLIKRSAFHKVGYFTETWQRGAFIDWYLRAQDLKLNIQLLPDVVVKRRLHKTNIGITAKNHQNDFVKILKVALDRRRKLTHETI